MTPWPDLTDGNAVHGWRGETTTWRSSDAGRSDANSLFGKEPNISPKELLEFLSLETPPSLSPEQFSLPQCTIRPEVFWGKKANRRSPISLSTATGSGYVPAIVLRGAGDRDLLLTGAGNLIFPRKKAAAAPSTCQRQKHLSYMQCPSRTYTKAGLNKPADNYHWSSLTSPALSSAPPSMAARQRVDSQSNNVPAFTYVSLDCPIDGPLREHSAKHRKLMI